jgi:heterotetrameric sarcosine oxidase delta subunit
MSNAVHFRGQSNGTWKSGLSSTRTEEQSFSADLRNNMLEINCPFCGPRPESEFWCIGEGSTELLEATSSAHAVKDYLYLRSNTGADVTERWVHRYGCAEWLTVVRNTRTNRILKAEYLSNSSREEGKNEHE